MVVTITVKPLHVNTQQELSWIYGINTENAEREGDKMGQDSEITG